MGQEAQCTVRFGRKVARGKALLEHNALIFRGDLQLVIPFKEIASVAAARGALRVTFSGGTATFQLGPLAERWAERIRAPKSLVDKLGVKPGGRVAVLGVADAAFRRQLRERTADIAIGRPRPGSDLIFLLAERKNALRRLRTLRSRLKPNGALGWSRRRAGARSARPTSWPRGNRRDWWTSRWSRSRRRTPRTNS